MTDKELISRARAGDKDSLNELMDKYSPLVSRISRKYFLVGASHEDLEQEGKIGLYKAYLSYDENKYAAFKTFASICILRQIQTAVKLNNRDKNIPLNTYLSIDNQGAIVVAKGNDDDDNSCIYIPSSALTPEDNVLQEEKIKEINEQIEKVLSIYEKDVLKLFMDGNNYIEIAYMMGKDPKSIDNALSRIKGKLKFLRG